MHLVIRDEASLKSIAAVDPHYGRRKPEEGPLASAIQDGPRDCSNPVRWFEGALRMNALTF